MAGTRPLLSISPSRQADNTAPSKDQEIRQGLTSFAEYVIRLHDHNSDINGCRVLPAIVHRAFNGHDAVQKRINDFEQRGGDVISIMLLLTDRQNSNVDRLLENIRKCETDQRFEWHLSELSLHNDHGEICNFHPRGAGNMIQTATVIHAIVKRTVKQCIIPETVADLLTIPPPRGYSPNDPLPRPTQQAFPPCPPSPPGWPGPGPGAQPGPFILSVPPNRPPTRIPPSRLPNRLPSRRDSDTDSSSDTFSDLTRDRSFESQLRRARRRRRIRDRRAKKASVKEGSESDSSSDDNEDDNIFINLSLKKGDDIVAKLLELWTPRPDEADFSD